MSNAYSGKSFLSVFLALFLVIAFTSQASSQYEPYDPARPPRPCEPVAPESHLSINKVGGGSGTVLDPTRFTCGVQCDITVPSCTELVLKAVPDADSVFDHWARVRGVTDSFSVAQCPDSYSPECKITINGEIEVYAVFEVKTDADLAVTQLKATPPKPLPTSSVVIEAVVTNKGSGTSAAGWGDFGISKLETRIEVDPVTGHTSTYTSSWSNSHSVSIPVIAPGQTWAWSNSGAAIAVPGEGYYWIESSVRSVGEVINADNTKKFPYVVDITPPPAPTNFRAASTATTFVNLAWDAVVDNLKENRVAFRIYRNGVMLPMSTTLLKYTDTGLTPGQTYLYEIGSYDSSPLRNATPADQRTKLSVTLPR